MVKAYFLLFIKYGASFSSNARMLIIEIMSVLAEDKGV